MARQYLTPVSDSYGDFVGVAPQIWFGIGEGAGGHDPAGSGPQITTNLWTYVREGTGSNPPAAGDGNVVLIVNNLSPNTASLVFHLSSGSAPVGQPYVAVSQSVRNETGAIGLWQLQVVSGYVNESNIGVVLGQWDDHLQIVSQSIPSDDIIISHLVTGTITDYTALSVRFVQYSPTAGGDRAFLEWITLVVDTATPPGKIWIAQSPVSGNFTGTFAGDGTQVVNIVSSTYAQTSSLLLGSVVSASYAATASVLLGSVQSASFAATAATAQAGSGTFTGSHIGTHTDSVKSVTTTYTGSSLDSRLIGDTTSGSFTILLPDASQLPNGRRVSIIKPYATASLTVQGSGSQQINNQSTIVLTAASSSFTVENSGSTWQLIEGYSSSYTVTASYALTASFAANAGSGGGGTTTGSFTGSFTGSITGSVTGNLQGSASFATTASAATSLTFTPATASYALTAGVALSGTGSWTGSVTGNLQGSASFATTASAATSLTFTPATASYALTAGAALAGSGSFTGSFAGVYAESLKSVIGLASYTASSLDGYVIGDTTSGSFTILLPDASKLPNGTIFTVFKPYATAALTIQGSGSQQIDNAPTVVLVAPSSSITIQNSGSVWQLQKSYSSSFATSASFAITASTAISITFTPATASYALTAGTALAGSGSWTGSVTGNLQGSASFATTASAATSLTFTPATASYALTAGVALSGTGSWTGSVTGNLQGSASFATTASAATSLTFNPATASYALTAGSALAGSGTFTGSFIGTYAESLKSVIGLASYTASALDGYLIGDTTSGSFTILLPDASKLPNGTIITVFKPYATATLTIQGSGSQQIDNAASVALGMASSSLTIQNSGSVWQAQKSYSSSFATTASFASNVASGAVSSVLSASYAITASAINFTPATASYALTAGVALSGTGSWTGSITGNLQGSASFATTASAATSLTFTPATASYALTAGTALAGSGSFTGSFLGTYADSVKSVIGVGSYTASSLDAYLIGDTTSGSFTILLPDASKLPFGTKLSIIKPYATATLTVQGSGSQQINNQASIALTAASSSFTVENSGTVWQLKEGFTSSYALSASAGGPNFFANSITASAFKGDGTQIVNVVTASFALSAGSSGGGLTGPGSASKVTIYSTATTLATGAMSEMSGVLTVSESMVVSGNINDTNWAVSASAFTGSVTGNLLGSASFATTASAATSLTFTPATASYTLTAGNALAGSGTFTGSLVGTHADSVKAVIGVASYTASGIDNYLIGDTTSGSFVILLPDASTLPNGRRFSIIKPYGTGTLTIQGSGSQQINNQGTIVLTVASSSLTVENSGTVWQLREGYSSSYALTASFASTLASGAISSVLSASYAITASAINFTPATASYALTAGVALSGTGSWTGSVTGNLQGSASFATTASAATSITFTPATASYALTAGTALAGTGTFTGSYLGIFADSVKSVIGVASYTASALDGRLIGDTTSGSFTILLPDASTLPFGRRVSVIKPYATASLTVQGSGSQQINNQASVVLTVASSSFTVETSGTVWQLIEGYSSSYALTSSFATTASFVGTTISASYALTASAGMPGFAVGDGPSTTTVLTVTGSQQMTGSLYLGTTTQVTSQGPDTLIALAASGSSSILLRDFLNNKNLRIGIDSTAGQTTGYVSMSGENLFLGASSPSTIILGKDVNSGIKLVADGAILFLTQTDIGQQSSNQPQHVYVQNYVEIGKTPNSPSTIVLAITGSETITGSLFVSGAINNSGYAVTATSVTASGATASFAGTYLDNTKAVTTTYTASNLDQRLIGDTTSGSFTILLPDAGTFAGGRKLSVIKPYATASLTVQGSGSQQINNQATIVLTVASSSFTVASSGSTWQLIEGYSASYALTASNATTSSFALTVPSGALSSVLSASFATTAYTASYATNSFTVTGTLAVSGNIIATGSVSASTISGSGNLFIGGGSNSTLLGTVNIGTQTPQVGIDLTVKSQIGFPATAGVGLQIFGQGFGVVWEPAGATNLFGIGSNGAQTLYPSGYWLEIANSGKPNIISSFPAGQAHAQAAINIVASGNLAPSDLFVAFFTTGTILRAWIDGGGGAFFPNLTSSLSGTVTSSGVTGSILGTYSDSVKSVIGVGSYTASANDNYLIGDTTSGSFTILLPDATTLPFGRRLTVFKPYGTGTVTVQGSGSQQINNQGTQVLTNASSSFTIENSGSVWMLQAGFSSSWALTASFALTSAGNVVTANSASAGNPNFFANSITASVGFQGNGAGITGVVSASYAGTASVLLGSVQSASFATTAATAQAGSGTFTGSFLGTYSDSIKSVIGVASYTASSLDNYLIGDTTSGSFTILLPDASKLANGTRLSVIKPYATASLTVQGSGSQQINNQATIVLTLPSSSFTVENSGTVWQLKEGYSSSFAVTASAATSITFVPATASYALTAGTALAGSGTFTGSHLGTFAESVKAVTTTYTGSSLDGYLIGDTTSGSFTLLLPDASKLPNGTMVTVFKPYATATLTIQGSGSQQINNQGSMALTAASSSITIQNSGSVWMLQGGLSSSYAVTSSFAVTASFASTVPSGALSAVLSSSYAVTSSFATTASYAPSRFAIAHAFYPHDLGTGSMVPIFMSGSTTFPEDIRLYFSPIGNNLNDWAQYKFTAVGYPTGAAMTASVGYFMPSGTLGNVVWGVQFNKTTAGSTDSYPSGTWFSASFVTSSVPTTSGTLKEETIFITGSATGGLNSSFTQNDLLRMMVFRSASSAVDTTIATASLSYVIIRYTLTN